MKRLLSPWQYDDDGDLVRVAHVTGTPVVAIVTAEGWAVFRTPEDDQPHRTGRATGEQGQAAADRALVRMRALPPGQAYRAVTLDELRVGMAALWDALEDLGRTDGGKKLRQGVAA